MTSRTLHIGKKSAFRIVFLCFAVFFGAKSCTAQTAADTSVSALLTRAYSLLSTDKQEAIGLFERAILKEPNNLLARRQLGYLYLSEYENAKSLEHFQAAERIQSSDTIKLQVAYILISLQRHDEAKSVFRELKGSQNSEIREQAETQLEVMPAPVESKRNWARIYADPYYDTRWSSGFLHFNFQDGYYFSDGHQVGLYGVIALAADTKSEGGRAPVIISDNSVLVGAGLRFNLFENFFVDVQEGIALELIKSDTRNEMKNDFRAIAYYAGGVYAPYSYHRNMKTPFAPFWDFFASAGYYSRYRNGIGYCQLRAGLRLMEVSHTVLDSYLLSQFVFDAEHQFYNNLLENGVGLRLTPDVHLGLHFVAEYHRGYYLNVTEGARRDREELYGPSYDSGRFMIIFDHTF